MAIILDETTRGEYTSQTLSANRAAVVVGALAGTVVVEVFDGLGVLRASGTMAPPWATRVNEVITVGEVTGTGMLVTGGGLPDANWYCQFRSGTRFVRGTFGLPGSGRDFIWSLSSFLANSRGTLGTVTMTATGDSAPTGDPLTYPLVTQSDLSYAGAFLPPTNTDFFAYDGGWPGIDETAGTMYMVGGTGSAHRGVAEITIPALKNPNAVSGSNATKAASLNQASIIQSVADGSVGRFVDPQVVTGALVHNGRLILSGGGLYGNPPGLAASHIARSKTLSNNSGIVSLTAYGAASGNYREPRMWSGYMAHIPTEWQALLGGPCLTGYTAPSIVSSTSDGPAAMVFDPDNINGTATQLIGTPLVGYHFTTPLDGGDPDPNGTIRGGYYPRWNWTGEVAGCCIPAGTRTLLFFGVNGHGQFYYGPGVTNRALHGTPAAGGAQIYCYDPTSDSNGEHAYPYRYQAWAYDLATLLAVKNGTLQPHQAQPYAWWPFNLPMEGTFAYDYGLNVPNPDPDPDPHTVRGMVYQRSTRRIYFVTTRGIGFGLPTVHAFTVNNATT